MEPELFAAFSHRRRFKNKKIDHHLVLEELRRRYRAAGWEFTIKLDKLHQQRRGTALPYRLKLRPA